MQFDTGALECENELNQKLNTLFYRENANAKLVEPWSLGIENAAQYIKQNWKQIVATSLGPYLRGDVLYHDLVKRNSTNGVLELTKDEYSHLQHVYRNRTGKMVNVIIEFCVDKDMLKPEAITAYCWMHEKKRTAKEITPDTTSSEPPDNAVQNKDEAKVRPNKKRKK